MSTRVNATSFDLLSDTYREPSVPRRIIGMARGLSCPRQSRAYKAARIELQRMAAPVSAVLVPLTALFLLLVLSTASTSPDPVIETVLLKDDGPAPLVPLKAPRETEAPLFDEPVEIPVMAPEVRLHEEAQPVRHESPENRTLQTARLLKSPALNTSVFAQLRTCGTRSEMIARHGSDNQTEDAVLRALRWLKKNQQPDGSWRTQKVAMTSLGVLVFLAHGEKPGDSPEFGGTVQKALEFLLGSQRPDGRFNGADSHEYAHPIATYALCEAYGMTLNPNVKAAAERALVPIIRGQHPTGGWTYGMDPDRDKDSGTYRDDTSYMGWCVQALKAAKLATLHADGLDKAVKLAVRGFKKNAGPDGGFGYTGPGRDGLTGVGTLCMQLLGASGEPEVRKSLDIIGSWRPSFSRYEFVKPGMSLIRDEQLKPGETRLSAAKTRLAHSVAPDEKRFFTASAQYYFYYATQCLFHQGGKNWEAWNRDMKKRYTEAQSVEKGAIKDCDGIDRDIGWWENADTFTDRPVMDTCLTALQLMVYYRYLPTTGKEAVQTEAEIKISTTDEEDVKVGVPLYL